MIYWKQCTWNQEYYISEYGEVLSTYKKQDGCLLKGAINSSGYKYYLLMKDGKFKWRFAHHLSMEYYGAAAPSSRHEINHIDGNKLNCHYTNLEWVTHSENQLHSYRKLNRNTPVGPAHWSYGKTTNDSTKKLMSLKKQGVLHPKFKGWYVYDGCSYTSSCQASKVTGVNHATIISWAKNNKNGWSFLPK